MPPKAIEPSDNVPFSARIVEIRGVRVLLDRDVAALFSTEVRKLNQQVSRNQERFLDDFAFRLSWEEFEAIRSQNVIFQRWTSVTYPPMAFTEYGLVMAATILKSHAAIEATRTIVRSFVDLRREAWEREVAKRDGQMPLGLNTPIRQGLMTKLNIALGRVLEELVDPEKGTTVRDEARAVATEGIKSLKDYLKRVGVANEKTLAEVQKLLAEAEDIRVTTARKQTENEHRQLALIAKKLRLVIQAQQYADTGSVDGLLVVLSELEKDN